MIIRWRPIHTSTELPVLLLGGPRPAAAARFSVVGQDVLGELVQTTAGTWITHPPTRCPNGHQLGPNQVLVGHVACLGHGGGGHTSWHCRTCEDVAYGPPLNTHCTCLDGPATGRISNAGARSLGVAA